MKTTAENYRMWEGPNPLAGISRGFLEGRSLSPRPEAGEGVHKLMEVGDGQSFPVRGDALCTVLGARAREPSPWALSHQSR
jgi:hypothetical protein